MKSGGVLSAHLAQLVRLITMKWVLKGIIHCAIAGVGHV